MAWNQNQGQPNNGQNPYGTPQNPNFYYPPSQNPYAAPTMQSGIPQFGNPPYYQPGYGNVPPQGPAPSVGQSIKALPKQYLNVVNHPSTIVFYQEINKANWLMVWLQLGIMIFVAILLGTIRELFAPLIIGTASLSSSSYRPSAEIRVKIGHRGNGQKQEKRFLSVLCGYISQISDIL